jgi:hypothetical protein
MAFYPKQIPTLYGKAAARFNQIAYENATKNKGTVDFSKEIAEARAKLAKSKLKSY